MKKTGYILFIAVFLLLCLIPSVGLLIVGPAEPAANEVPAALPKVKDRTGSWNTAYFTELRDYIGKGFFLRLEGITGWDTLASSLFHSSENEDVLIGPDGWLFYGAAAEEISGSNRMTDREIYCAARSLYLMQEYAESQNAAFVFTVPCGKYTLYPDHAPDYVTVSTDSNLQRLTQALEAEGVCYADLYSAFSGQDEVLYWQWDSHWNARGAALAADTILHTLGRDADYFGTAFDVATNHTGDLYSMLYPTGRALEDDYVPLDPLSFSYTSNFHNYDDMVISTEGGGTGSLLMFRDSSGRNLYPYMADAYGKAYFSRVSGYDLTLIAAQEADAVVVELAERTLDYLLKNTAVFPSPLRDAAVLDAAVPVDSELTAADESGVEGCIKLTGTLPVTDMCAQVYVRTNTGVYEAIPNVNSFTAYIPSELLSGSVQVFVTQ